MGTLKRDSVKINDGNWMQSRPVTPSSSLSDQSLRFVPPSNRVDVGATIPQPVDLSSITPDGQDYTLATS
ncbi:hypothetical protein RRG08_023454 [Elysia crispata]|uniref:Uncharacterized protein n=1 Tax=Elysia crispata TaxID=231223 RepID=A0AAE1AEC0_9GAST|nr:hypothetical protein RRG08_023454 [Elysia crispata]